VRLRGRPAGQMSGTPDHHEPYEITGKMGKWYEQSRVSQYEKVNQKLSVIWEPNLGNFANPVLVEFKECILKCVKIY